MALRNRAALEQRATFPLWVKRWRAYLGVTQKQFAALWGVSPSMVQKIETNDYSVGQLSFDRLENLRVLLKLEPAVFYGILSENDPGREAREVVKVTRLDADLKATSPVSLPSFCLGEYQAREVLSLELSPRTFAPDRLRYALSRRSLLVVAKHRSPLPLDLVVGTKMLQGQPHLVIFKHDARMPEFLRPFDPQDERYLEITQLAEVDLLGVYVGHWSSLHPA